MSEEQVADTIGMLYQRLNSYNKQDLFNYGYLLESNQILCKNIEEKDKEIERLNNIINELEEFLKQEIERLMHIEQSNNVIFIIGAYTEVLDKIQELKKESEK